MYGPLNQVRDGALTTALVLETLAVAMSGNSSGDGNASPSFSQLISTLPRTYQFKTKYNCSARETSERIVQAFMNHGTPKKVETLDGAKVWIDEETWLMVRPSGTEPLVRMYGESTDKSLLDSKANEYCRIIEEQIGTK